jgi:hypothetical protein
VLCSSPRSSQKDEKRDSEGNEPRRYEQNRLSIIIQHLHKANAIDTFENIFYAFQHVDSHDAPPHVGD